MEKIIEVLSKGQWSPIEYISIMAGVFVLAFLLIGVENLYLRFIKPNLKK